MSSEGELGTRDEGELGYVGVASLEGSFGVKECDREWTCVGARLWGDFEPLSSNIGVDVDTESPGSVELRGGAWFGGEDDDGGVVAKVGKGCLAPGDGEVGLPVECALARLSLLARYSATRSWNELLTGEKAIGLLVLLRSSADLDQPRFDIFLRSPKPPPPPLPLDGMVGLEGVLGAWGKRGMSKEFCVLVADRSRTEL